MNFKELKESMQTSIDLDKDAATVNAMVPCITENTPVYISIGPACVPLTVEINKVSSLYGKVNGLVLHNKDLELTDEEMKVWVKLRDRLMKSGEIL